MKVYPLIVGIHAYL